jgi:mannose-6-phosphate isomerase-like protein (cupin superfamily)
VRDLPAGVERFDLPADGGLTLTDGFLTFIDAGQRARYLIGDAQTAPHRPSNATVKIGVVRPHSAFTPHAHGGEHYVLSLGYAACTLYDAEPVGLTLTPGQLIRIPAMMPHSFANRGRKPLLILAANTGFGIDHEDYAITAEAAEARAGTGPESGPLPSGREISPELVKALRALEQAPAVGGLTWRERLAATLRAAATRLERTR